MSDQFDLEQGIMNCWMITSDIDTLMEEVIEGDLTKDQIANVLMGLSQLYEIKFQKTFRIFEEFLKEYYRMRDDLKHMQAELEEFQDAKYSSDEALELIEDEESEF